VLVAAFVTLIPTKTTICNLGQSAQEGHLFYDGANGLEQAKLGPGYTW